MHRLDRDTSGRVTFFIKSKKGVEHRLDIPQIDLRYIVLTHDTP